MHTLDLLIIVLYFLLMIAVGWWVAKKAAKDSESYFLAGKSLPWWVIGVAHGILWAGFCRASGRNWITLKPHDNA
jgi:Na+/proline symporter